MELERLERQVEILIRKNRYLRSREAKLLNKIIDHQENEISHLREQNNQLTCEISQLRQQLTNLQSKISPPRRNRRSHPPCRPEISYGSNKFRTPTTYRRCTGHSSIPMPVFEAQKVDDSDETESSGNDTYKRHAARTPIYQKRWSAMLDETAFDEKSNN